MRFKLRQMEAFRAVMLTGSMNGAARLLFISQPAVSRMIAYTEQSLGLRLFDRTSGKVVPTAEAELLFREVEAMYDSALRVDDFARDLVSQPQGTLTICTSPSLALNFVPPVVARFVQDQPEVRLKYHTALLSEMAHQLTSRKADLAVCVLPIEDPNLIVEPFAEGRMVAIVPHGHPLATRRALEPRDIVQYPLILYSRNIPFGQIVATALQRAGLDWRSSIDIHRAELACALVRAGAGVAIVDEFSVSGAGWPGIVVKPLWEAIPLTLSLARARFVRPSRQAREFTKLVKAHAGMMKRS